MGRIRANQVTDRFREDVEGILSYCLLEFPELERPELLIMRRDVSALTGCAGVSAEGKHFIILVVPLQFYAPDMLRPLIYHELSHLIDPRDPEGVFATRADNWSRKVWSRFTKMGIMECSARVVFGPKGV